MVFSSWDAVAPFPLPGDASASAPSLDPDQAAVVSAVVAEPARVVLALGAPGTGKTWVAQHAVRQLVAGQPAGAGPDGAVVLAPTRVRADQLAAELSEHIPGTRTEPLVRTPSSLAFAILRRAAVAADDPLPRLLTGAEQDTILRELLEGHVQDRDGSPSWPADMRSAVGTAGFRGQLRELFMRASEHGLDPPGLRSLGQRHARPEWVAAAEVLREYEQVTALGTPGAYDPATICTAAASAVEADPDLRRDATGALRLLVVDDAQELTASAAHLVATVATPQVRVLLIGDGDAAVQGFRGALPRRFVQLADELAQERAGTSAHLSRFVLRTRHRQGAVLARPADEVVRCVGVTTGTAHRGPRLAADHPLRGQADGAHHDGPTAPAGEAVEVAVMPSVSQEAELVAYRLRRAHLLDGLGWSQMVVICRSGARQAAMRRALQSAGVPVRSAPLNGPLAADPAVRPLLLAYEAVLRWCEGMDRLDPSLMSELLSSALTRADPVALRRLRRAARRQAAGSAGDATTVPRTTDGTDALLGRWVLDPLWGAPLGVADPDLEPLMRLARVLRAGRDALVDGEGAPVRGRSAHSVLWALWDASAVAALWERESRRGGSSGARADRHLDAVMVLFGAVQDYTERLGRHDPWGFATHLGGQQVASDSLVAQGAAGEEVAVLTPQAAAGGQWHLVAVVGVQEGVWPNLQLRGSLLGSESLVDVLHQRPVDGPEGVRSAWMQVHDDELRQFYVSLTRARRRLLVTAVATVDEQPSVFVDLVRPAEGTGPSVTVPPRLTLRGVVADLRRDLVRAHRSGDRERRDACADRLRELSREGVAWADPATWLDARTISGDAPRVPAGPVTVAPSALQTFQECALRWFLTRHGADSETRVSSAVGTLVHDIV
ncbi:MAG: UvrD-helicase domain-containing protein, partial [Ornithinimicrobium sp.]